VKIVADFSAASRRAKSVGGVVFERGEIELGFVVQDKGSAVPYHGFRTFLSELAAFSESEGANQLPPYHMVSSGFGSLGWMLARRRPGAARGLLGFLAALPVALAVLIAIGDAFAMLISNTDSTAPACIFRVVSHEVRRGELVAACLSFDIAQLGLSRGYLPTGPSAGNAEPVGKIAGAVPGDIVDIERDWIAVNGRRIAHSAIVSRDSAGRPLAHTPFGRRRVRAGELWLLGFNDRRSWDSRYFRCDPGGEGARPNRTDFCVVTEMTNDGHSHEEGLRVHHLANLGGLIAIAGLDLEPPDFLLGALLSLAQEAAKLSGEQREQVATMGRSKLNERATGKRAWKSWNRARQLQAITLSNYQLRDIIEALGREAPEDYGDKRKL
jgi:type IV secretory pathway protease TraF